jgi:hypothetical protein
MTSVTDSRTDNATLQHDRNTGPSVHSGMDHEEAIILAERTRLVQEELQLPGCNVATSACLESFSIVWDSLAPCLAGFNLIVHVFGEEGQLEITVDHPGNARRLEIDVSAEGLVRVSRVSAHGVHRTSFVRRVYAFTDHVAWLNQALD